MAQIKHGTLVAATVATVTITGQPGRIEVVNRDAALEIFFTINSVNPTVNGDDCQICPPASSVEVVASGTVSSGNTTVKLISSGTPAYTVGAADA